LLIELTNLFVYTLPGVLISP